MTDERDGLGKRLFEIARAFLKLGALSYGGPAIMGIMQAELQEKRQWLSKERFLEGLALVNMLPGPAATQLGIFIGYDRAGWRGGIVAGFCFMLPAFAILLALTLAYSAYGSVGFMRDAFYGIGPVVLAVFAVAVYRLGKNALKGRAQIVLALCAAAMVAVTPLGIAPTLLLAACAGVALYHSRSRGIAAALVVLALVAITHAIGASPIAAGSTGAEAVPPALWQLALFFFQTGALTFGGGITVLAFVQEQVVNQLQWLTPREFLDGLALGQLTPGPILMLAAYVGYKTSGIAGAAVSAAAIFLPAFVLMLSLMPVLSRFKHLMWIKAAMRGVSAAVIGCLAVTLTQLLPHAAPDAFALVLFAATAGALLLWRLGPLPLVLAGGVLGIIARWKPLQRLKELTY